MKHFYKVKQKDLVTEENEGGKREEPKRPTGDPVISPNTGCSPVSQLLPCSVKVKVLITQSCLTLCGPITCSPGFPCGSPGKESTCNSGDLGLILGLGRSPGGGKGYPLQYSGLENSINCIVHGVTKSWTQMSDFHFQFQC